MASFQAPPGHLSQAEVLIVSSLVEFQLTVNAPDPDLEVPITGVCGTCKVASNPHDIVWHRTPVLQQPTARRSRPPLLLHAMVGVILLRSLYWWHVLTQLCPAVAEAGTTNHLYPKDNPQQLVSFRQQFQVSIL